LIGASIFSLAAITTGLAGPAALLSIVIAGSICFLTATTYAQLGGCCRKLAAVTSGCAWPRRRAGSPPDGSHWFGHTIGRSFYIVIFAGGLQYLLHEIGLAAHDRVPLGARHRNPVFAAAAAGVALLFIW